MPLHSHDGNDTVCSAEQIHSSYSDGQAEIYQRSAYILRPKAGVGAVQHCRTLLVATHLILHCDSGWNPHCLCASLLTFNSSFSFTCTKAGLHLMATIYTTLSYTVDQQRRCARRQCW